MSEELNPMQGIQQETENADQLAREIKYIQRQAQVILLGAAKEIGRRLCAAKELVPYGQWGNWLEENVDYSVSKANNLMRLYQSYKDNDQISFFGASDSQAFENLTVTQADALLALPMDQREKFVQEHDMSEMSTRELRKAIAAQQEAEKAQAAAEQARREAEERLEAAQSDIEEARSEAEKYKKLYDSSVDANIQQAHNANRVSKQRDKAEREAEKAKEEAERLQKELDAANARMKELTSAPAEVSEETRAEIEAEIKRKFEDQISQLTLDAETARQRAEAIAAEKAALEAKAAQQASDSMMKLNILFEQSQKTMQDMKRLIDGCPSEQRDKLNGLIMQTLTGIFGKS